MNYWPTLLLLGGAQLAALHGQLLEPAAFKNPPTDTWPTFNGDYTGQRHSPLAQIDASNVKSLALVWTHRVDLGPLSNSQQAWEGRRIKTNPLARERRAVLLRYRSHLGDGRAVRPRIVAL